MADNYLEYKMEDYHNGRLKAGKSSVKPKAKMPKFEIPAEVADWVKQIGCAVTICDTEGVILYMNDLAKETFKKHGDLIGRNLFPCHSARSQEMIRHMLATGDTNAYTITKNGIRKLIFQTPWRRNGIIAGMAEISIPLPADMPHYDRDAQ